MNFGTRLSKIEEAISRDTIRQCSECGAASNLPSIARMDHEFEIERCDHCGAPLNSDGQPVARPGVPVVVVRRGTRGDWHRTPSGAVSCS